jgi:signal transduction histidine kinase/CheY-like chemotaxis protein
MRFRLALAVALPFFAFALQHAFWAAIQPYAWFLFFPATFFSAWLAGFAGGAIATVTSTLLVWYYFIPPVGSFDYDRPIAFVSIAVFLGMGLLFGFVHERIRKANRATAEALLAARAANESLVAANARITQLYEKMRELDELKSQFFANVSHELRTPLTLILGPVARWLADARLHEEARRDLAVIERNARLLYRHVTDLLDVSRLDAGRMDMRYARADLAGLVRLMASHFETLAADKDIRFAVESPDALPAEVDVDKCRRIVLNLLSNAFKFTPEGGEVTLAVRPEEGRAVITVRDTGLGVPVAMREAVFERFRQVEGGADRRFGGTGLGLAIVHDFVALHHGAVAVTDAPGGGALFTVELPTTAPAGAPVAAAVPGEGDPLLEVQAAEELHGQREPEATAEAGPDAPLVLVVEDNPDMNTFLAQTLGRRYRVARAFDGREGLARAIDLRPDLILCDVMMPRLSGDEMVVALRRRPELRDVPVVMLTAKADEALRVKLLEAHVQDYLFKPFEVDELMARVGGLVRRRRESIEALREVVRATGAGYIEHTADFSYVYVSDRFAELLGERPEDVPEPRRILAWFTAHVDEPQRIAWAAAMDGFLAGRVPSLDTELAMGPRDGEPCWLRVVTASVRRDAEGRPALVASLLFDVSAHHRAEAEVRALNAGLERRVAERTRELEAANRELDTFADAVSHDLRAPLRAMSAFSQAALEDCGDELPAAAREDLEQIDRAAARMAELIEGLLALSRSARGELRCDRVDVSALAAGILAEHVRGEPERRVDWRVEPGLEVRGDARMIEVVLRNLLGNAWKYTAKTGAAEIRVSAEGDAICVADNGAGFDMAHAARLFEPFGRLHRQDEFPGIGIGLATVQRIVRRHGGDIRATAAPGRGATFCFRIPAPRHPPGPPD